MRVVRAPSNPAAANEQQQRRQPRERASQEGSLRLGHPRTGPAMLPSRHGAVRALLDRWFERHAIRPRVVGEFDDSALLKTFGSSGMGIFPAAERVEDELVARYDVTPVGRCDDVEERFFAIGTERKVTHPHVRLLVPGRSSAVSVSRRAARVLTQKGRRYRVPR